MFKDDELLTVVQL